MQALGDVEYAQSISWPDGVKDNLNQASVSLHLVLCIFVVSINFHLGFFLLFPYL